MSSSKGDLVLDSPPSSPNKNAAFSRFGPEVGRLPDLRNGEADLGGDDLVEDPEGVSGSSIHEKLDCAILDRVGTGALGLADATFSAFPAGFSCVFMVGFDSAGVIDDPLFGVEPAIGMDCRDSPLNSSVVLSFAELEIDKTDGSGAAS